MLEGLFLWKKSIHTVIIKFNIDQILKFEKVTLHELIKITVQTYKFK